MFRKVLIVFLFSAALWNCGPSGSIKPKADPNCALLDSFYRNHESRWNTKGLYEDISRLEKITGVNSLVDCGKDGCFYDTISYFFSDYVVWAEKLKCSTPDLSDSTRIRMIKERKEIVAERRRRVIPLELQ